MIPKVYFVKTHVFFFNLIIIFILIDIYLYVQLLALAQDVEHELLTQVLQVEKIEEKKFSKFFIIMGSTINSGFNDKFH